ncbi:MAG: aldolase/citrate lyase family protein [Candidatus Solibacter sp.]
MRAVCPAAPSIMGVNQTKAKLKAGETVIGCYTRHADPGLAEVLGHYGWDYLLFDGEHTPLSSRECENLARVCELRDVTPIVRIPANQPGLAGQFLDTGMQGVQFPMINSEAAARAAVQAVKYPPDGERGLAAARAANYGQQAGFHFRDHVAAANRETLVILQIETAASIAQLPGILRAPDADVIFIGPADLSLSLGCPGELNHPKVEAAFEAIVQAVTPTDKALGIMVPNAAAALHWKKRGARYIMIVMEALLGPTVREFLASTRERS